jgi:hypothetical protein
MADNEFSHKVLTMLLANRNSGSIGRFLDKLNEFVKEKQFSAEQKEEVLNILQDFFIEEHKVFVDFSEKIAEVIGERIPFDSSILRDSQN